MTDSHRATSTDWRLAARPRAVAATWGGAVVAGGASLIKARGLTEVLVLAGLVGATGLLVRIAAAEDGTGATAERAHRLAHRSFSAATVIALLVLWVSVDAQRIEIALSAGPVSAALWSAVCLAAGLPSAITCWTVEGSS